MRIVLNTRELAPLGGIEVQLFQVARELALRGHDLDVLCRSDTGPFAAQYHQLARSVSVVPSFDVARRTAVIDLARIAPAVARVRDRHGDVLYLSRIEEIVWAQLASRFARIPLVCHLHHVTGYAPDLLVRLLSGVDHIAAVSQFLKERYVALGLSPDRITIIPNGVDPDEYAVADESMRLKARGELGLPPDAFVVLCYGRVIRQKGVHVLVEAWRRLGLDPAHHVLVVLGAPDPADRGSYLGPLRDTAPAGVVWYHPRRDPVTFLHAADLVAVPTLAEESFGRVVIEAMATGLPVVASRKGGIPEILDGPLSRLLVEPGDPEALATAIADLLAWRSADPALGESCTAVVRARYPLSRTVEGTEALLTRAVAQRA
ncbi:MAG: glycosyltransferase family 1 protein [Actinomycetota bacterium]|nr:MAG: glycosyltransferase family 1 protein [Actinomycetota bacterium]